MRDHTIFDFNVHLVPDESLDTNGRLADEAGMGPDDLRQSYARHRHALRQSADVVNIMLFNQALPFQADGLDSWMELVAQDFPGSVFTQLLDFRHPDAAGAVRRSAARGISGIKFHSYVQEIADADIPKALAAARVAEACGLFICVDASYGTTRLYDYDNLKLAACLVREIREVPIVILHAGGARRWDVMLLAEENPRVYIESSFTLPYYEGSAVHGDLAFIFRKIGVDRILYASDFPYIPLERAVDCMERFLGAHGFSESERRAVFGGNAARLLEFRRSHGSGR